MSFARRSLQVVAFICTLVVGAAAMSIIVTQSAWFKEWLRRLVVRQAQDYVNGQVSIGRLDGNLFFGLELEDVDVVMDGRTVVDIKDVGLDYNAFTFILGDVVLDDIRLNQPVFHVERTAEGWNIARLIKARTPDAPRGRRTIEIGEIGVSNGSMYIEDAVGTSGVDIPKRIERFDASLGVKSDEDALVIDVGHVSFRAAEPSIGLHALSGVFRRTDGALAFENVSVRTEESAFRVDGSVTTSAGGTRVLDLDASSEKVALQEIGRIVPALRGYLMQPALQVTARGPIDQLAVDLQSRDASLGDVNGELTVDADGPERRVTGHVAMAHMNIAPLVRGASRAAHPPDISSDITGDAQIDLTLPSESAPLRGTYTLRAARARVAGYEARNVSARGRIDGDVVRVNGAADGYGGRATAVGTVTLGQPEALDLSGRAASLDMRNLPPQLNMPGVPSDLQFGYTVHGRRGAYAGTLAFDFSRLAGASIAAGTTGEFQFGGGAPHYAARGRVENLDVEQVGRGFAFPAFAQERFAGRINATFDLKGSGGGRYPLTLDARGTAVDSEMFGATFPQIAFRTHVADGNMRVSSSGSFAGLDPAVITRNALTKANLTGTHDLETTIRGYAAGLTIDSVDTAGRVDLAASEFVGLAINKAAFQGQYANREGQLELFEIAGPDLNAMGKGAIALNETGSSNLTVHVESPSLDRLGEVLGRPLRGAAIIDTIVTGNAVELRAEGTLQGSNIGYGSHRALELSSSVNMAVPNLTPEDATIQARSEATFVEIAGQQINELTADTTYAKGRLEFNAVAQEGVRELMAQGVSVLHPDHQEIHLANLVLRTEQVEWRSAPGTDAAIRYGTDRLGVEHVSLVSGDQRIDADGVIGSPTDVLRVRVQNVDVSQLDQLLLANQEMAGRLDANAVVSGPLSNPRVEGDFALRKGAFRAFMFEAFTGTLDYLGRGMTLDVRIDQSPQAWLTATGYAPLSLFSRNPDSVSGHDAPGEGEAIDLQIASSQVDLGLIQRLTTYVSDVTGALQANVTVTGTGQDPHFNGTIDVRGGTFTIPELGTAYTGLDTRIDLKTDVVTISEMRIVDAHQQIMTVGGTLAVHEGDVGAVDVRVRSENFEVIDNQVADLKLDTDVRVTGELRAPRIEGYVEVESGTIDVSRVMEQATADPYATDATSLEPAAPAADVPKPRPSILDALELNVGIAVPSNLVLRGADMRPVNAPIDMGDLNVTVGGAVQVQKARDGKPRLTGEVNTVRGSYTFQGRRFDILRDGRIRFAGEEDIDPVFDIRARRVISGVETFVRVQGTLRQPEMTFSSNPPLDQADILSLIVFNLPINELGEGQQVSLAERAGALAGGYLASGLTRSIANALELDEFEIQAEGDNGAGPSLSIGEQVGERLFVRVRQGFGASEATELILEYQIADFLRLQGAVAETSNGTQRVTFRRVERGGLDLIFFFSY